jgi:hypothetical protein
VGKSVACAYAGWMLATKWERGLDGLFFAPTSGQLQRTLLKAWEETVARPGSYLVTRSGSNPRIEIPLPGGRVSTIYLLSGEEHAAARLEGLNLAWACGDELQDVEKGVWDRVIGRVRHKSAKLPRRFGAGLPESGTWLEDDLVTEPAPGVKWVQGQTADNPHLNPGYLENLRRTLPLNLFRSRGLGLFSTPSGTVYPLFSREKHVKPCPYQPALQLRIGQDFNNDPMSSVLLQDVGPETWVVGELVEAGTTGEHAAKLAAWCEARGIQRVGGRFPASRVVIVPDASGSSRQHATGTSDHAILQAAGFTLDGPLANPLVKDRDNAVLARLETADGVCRLFFDPSCRKTIAAFSGLKHKGRDRSEHSHPVDAAGYVVHRHHPLERLTEEATLQNLSRARKSVPERKPRATF